MAMATQGDKKFTWEIIKNLSSLLSHMWYANTFAIDGWKWCCASTTKPLSKLEEDVNGFQVHPSRCSFFLLRERNAVSVLVTIFLKDQKQLKSFQYKLQVLVSKTEPYKKNWNVESVRHIFERHPDIAVEFRAKNQHLKKACMNFLLSLIETLSQSLQELSTEDLVEADIALTYLKDAGFKVEWLEKKLDQVKAKKEKEQFGLARLQELEDSLLKLKQKCSELDALVEKEEAELLATRTPLSFDDVV